MKDKLLISFLPITSILLLGAKANPNIEINTEISYQDKVDKIIIGAGEKGYLTDIYFSASFRSAGINTNKNTIKVYKLNPLVDKYELIKTFETTKRRIEEKFQALELFDASEYASRDYYGPIFRFNITCLNQKSSQYFDAYLTSPYDEKDALNSYLSNSNTLISENNIFSYYGKEEFESFVSESFFVTDMMERKIYDFDAQNYLDFLANIISSKVNTSLFDISSFTYSDAYLFLLDMNNYFPHLHSERNSAINIKGKIVAVDDGYGFEITDNLYIDPTTRLTYFEHLEGTIKTKKLYFPVNVANMPVVNEVANRAFIFINRVGLSKSKLVLGVDFNSFMDGLIGECATSDYCIKVEPTIPDFEIGETFLSDD